MSTLSFPYSPLVLAVLIAGVLLKPLYAGDADPAADTRQDRPAQAQSLTP